MGENCKHEWIEVYCVNCGEDYGEYASAKESVAPNWISIEKDGLPKKEGRYLIVYKLGNWNKGFVVDFYFDDNDELNGNWNLGPLDVEVLYWMPYPEIPLPHGFVKLEHGDVVLTPQLGEEIKDVEYKPLAEKEEK